MCVGSTEAIIFVLVEICPLIERNVPWLPRDGTRTPFLVTRRAVECTSVFGSERNVVCSFETNFDETWWQTLYIFVSTFWKVRCYYLGWWFTADVFEISIGTARSLRLQWLYHRDAEYSEKERKYRKQTKRDFKSVKFGACELVKIVLLLLAEYKFEVSVQDVCNSSSLSTLSGHKGSCGRAPIFSAH